MLSEVNQTEEDKNHMISLISEIKKKLTNKTNKKLAHRYVQQIGGYQRGKGSRD